MKPAEEIENVVKHMSFAASDEMDQRLWADASRAQEKLTKTRPASGRNWERNTIMKNPITKLAIAAAIIATVVLGLSELFSTKSTSGVVWGEVLQKLQASRGVIYRERNVTGDQDAHTIESDYVITYLSPTQYRSDGYKEGRLWMTMYDNRATAKRVVLLHAHKGYVREDITLTDQTDAKHASYQDPTFWARKFMACEYTKLSPREIDGTLCEGIETTDPAFLASGGPRVDSYVARLWVSVETGYAVLLEGEFKGDVRRSVVYDQFQWDAELDASLFEPDIPAGYQQM